jgi:DNA-directed RNA polymerase subunit RPC12/RpoP
MIREKIVTGRKEYKCIKCNAKILKGTKHISRTIADGKIRTERQCLDCKDHRFLVLLSIIAGTLLAVILNV